MNNMYFFFNKGRRKDVDLVGFVGRGKDVYGWSQTRERETKAKERK
jgi:hypothetical protein